jgi:hypothetical protein
VDVLIFLCPYIWSHVSGLMRFCDESEKGKTGEEQTEERAHHFL